jgi:hypothetical protein
MRPCNVLKGRGKKIGASLLPLSLYLLQLTVNPSDIQPIQEHIPTHPIYLPDSELIHLLSTDKQQRLSRQKEATR